MNDSDYWPIFSCDWLKRYFRASTHTDCRWRSNITTEMLRVHDFPIMTTFFASLNVYGPSPPINNSYTFGLCFCKTLHLLSNSGRGKRVFLCVVKKLIHQCARNNIWASFYKFKVLISLKNWKIMQQITISSRCSLYQSLDYQEPETSYNKFGGNILTTSN